MSPLALLEPVPLHPEQICAKKPWERQEGESAKWFFRFRNFLHLGPKRSVNAAFELERKDKKEKSRTNAGPEWYGAARRYQWQARADAWDNEQDEQKAAQMRQIAMQCAFTSRPYRIAQLNSMAEGLSRALENELELSISLATVKQLIALMQELAKEIEAWGVHFDASCDAAALDAFQRKQKRLQAQEQEKQDAQDEEMDRMLAQLILHNPEILPDYNPDEIADQLEGRSQTKIADLIEARLGLDKKGSGTP